MATRTFCKLALAAVAAVGLYAPTLGLPLPSRLCPRTAGVATAAPSPTCSSDLRECLHAAAKTDIYGVRYVLPEDVARCVEAFNACAHGNTSGGGNPVSPTSTSARGDDRTGSTLPQRFTMKFEGYASDCRVNGDTVTCTSTLEPRPADIDSFAATFSGTLSGSTVTGTEARHQQGHYANGCTFDENYSTPYTYVFGPDGSVTLNFGPGQRQSTFSCAEATSATTPRGEVAGTWTPLK
ncbi:hypothetical protein [Mycobacterium attenuatum]|uniref:hypothetical protein n=1 Tax=Mycobacterium attenuatum TaxID=2341086 RepID=UPI000F027C94|nr:hypothetical protein [Mycobacterium attenuatum]VBA61034.1 hypothetical protein LAUMK41_04405 [Mycobacterium attenuatum]